MSLGPEVRGYIERKVRDGIKGRMMEDIILFETAMAYPEKRVFVLQFPVGEFDMVVSDAEGCRIFEIKHSTEAIPLQYRHLVDEEKCRRTEAHFGRILEKGVIYRGKEHWDGDIHYINAEEYLRKL